MELIAIAAFFSHDPLVTAVGASLILVIGSAWWIFRR